MFPADPVVVSLMYYISHGWCVKPSLRKSVQRPPHTPARPSRLRGQLAAILEASQRQSGSTFQAERGLGGARTGTGDTSCRSLQATEPMKIGTVGREEWLGARVVRDAAATTAASCWTSNLADTQCVESIEPLGLAPNEWGHRAGRCRPIRRRACQGGVDGGIWLGPITRPSSAPERPRSGSGTPSRSG